MLVACCAAYGSMAAEKKRSSISDVWTTTMAQSER